MEGSLKVGCLPSVAGKQSCLHAWMSDVSHLCVTSGSRTLNGGDDDDSHSPFSCLSMGMLVMMMFTRSHNETTHFIHVRITFIIEFI